MFVTILCGVVFFFVRTEVLGLFCWVEVVLEVYARTCCRSMRVWFIFSSSGRVEVEGRGVYFFSIKSKKSAATGSRHTEAHCLCVGTPRYIVVHIVIRWQRNNTFTGTTHMCTSIFIYSTSLESLVETHPLILYVQFSEPPLT